MQLTLITDDPCPAIGTVTAVPVRIAQASVGAVITGQAAVMAKSVIQTHC